MYNGFAEIGGQSSASMPPSQAALDAQAAVDDDTAQMFDEVVYATQPGADTAAATEPDGDAELEDNNPFAAGAPDGRIDTITKAALEFMAEGRGGTAANTDQLDTVDAMLPCPAHVVHCTHTSRKKRNEESSPRPRERKRARARAHGEMRLKLVGEIAQLA